MSFLDPRVWLALALTCACAYGAGRWQQWRADEQAHQATLLKATQAAMQTERNLRDDMEVLDEVRTKELLAVARQRDAALASLRNRPERLSETSRAACSGATGAELARPDGQFLARFAADAAGIERELRACEARERATFEALKGKP